MLKSGRIPWASCDRTTDEPMRKRMTLLNITDLAVKLLNMCGRKDYPLGNGLRIRESAQEGMHRITRSGDGPTPIGY
jgi:hypothetical protein